MDTFTAYLPLMTGGSDQATIAPSKNVVLRQGFFVVCACRRMVCMLVLDGQRRTLSPHRGGGHHPTRDTGRADSGVPRIRKPPVSSKGMRTMLVLSRKMNEEIVVGNNV